MLWEPVSLRYRSFPITPSRNYCLHYYLILVQKSLQANAMDDQRWYRLMYLFQMSRQAGRRHNLQVGSPFVLAHLVNATMQVHNCRFGIPYKKISMNKRVALSSTGHKLLTTTRLPPR